MKKNIKILVVDDNPTHLELIQTLLDELGYVVVVANDGIEAMNYLNGDDAPPSLILSDIEMPQMDGFELCAEIQKTHSEIPVIIFTSYAGEESLKKAFEAGAMDFLGNPFSKVELSVRLKNTLDIQKGKVARQRVTTILSSINDAFFALDNDLVITYFNDAAEKMLGRKREDVLGEKIFDAFPEAKGSVFEENYTKSIKEKIPLRFDVYFEKEPYKNWYSVKTYPQKNGISIYFQVVTELRETILKLQESQQRLSSFMLSATEGFILLDSELKYLIINDNALWYFTDMSKREDVIGKNILEVGPVLRSNGVYEKYLNVVKTGKSFFYEKLVHHKKFGDIHLSIRVFRVNKGLGLVLTDITERVKVEEEFARQRDFAESLINTAKTIILVLDLNGRIIRFNPYMEEISGYSLDEVRGKDWFITFLPENDRARIRKLFQDSVTGIPVKGNVNPIVTKDGRERQIEWYDNKLEGLDGNPLGLLVVGQDITERMKVEEEFTKQRDFAEGLINTAKTIILLLDLDGRIISFNPYMEEISGYASDEVKGKDWFTTFLPPQDYSKTRKIFKDSVLNGIRTKGNVNPIIAKDGREVQIEWYDNEMRDSAGEIIGLLAVGQDITGRMKAEKALKESEGTLRRLFDSEMMGFLFWNSKGEITGANKAFLKMVGYTQKDLSSGQLNWQELTPPEYAEVDRKALKELADTGKTLPFEKAYIHKDGSSVPVILGATVLSETGVVGGAAFVLDITDRKEAEEKIANLAKFPAEDPNPVLRVTKEGAVTYINESGIKLIGEYWHCTLGKCMPEDFNKLLKESIISGRTKIREFTLGDHVFLFSITPIKGTDYVNVYSQDITERKRYELELESTAAELENAHKHAIYMLAIASEYKDPEVGEHINRIAKLTTELALELGIKPELAEQMGTDSLLHDLGKLGISDYILLKPGELTSDEFSTMKQHVTIGAKIIGGDEWFREARQIALYHHERWDGKGYPKGLKAEAIPFAARIVAVADVFDALITKRPYKEQWLLEKAVLEVKNDSGKHFDPKVIKAFLSLHKKGKLKKYFKREKKQ